MVRGRANAVARQRPTDTHPVPTTDEPADRVQAMAMDPSGALWVWCARRRLSTAEGNVDTFCRDAGSDRPGGERVRRYARTRVVRLYGQPCGVVDGQQVSITARTRIRTSPPRAAQRSGSARRPSASTATAFRRVRSRIRGARHSGIVETLAGTLAERPLRHAHIGGRAAHTVDPTYQAAFERFRRKNCRLAAATPLPRLSAMVGAFMVCRDRAAYRRSVMR